jgi:hypothetical protein
MRVRPALRMLETASARVSVEPLVMHLLVTLSRRAGKLVTRSQVFDACWGAAAVGDDSLNRGIAELRKALRKAAGGAVQIETVPASGYVLRLADDRGEETAVDCEPVADAIAAGYDSWRLALPEPDHIRLEQLRRACAIAPDNAKAWGMLALLYRHAAEYGDLESVSESLSGCEAAARRAIALESGQPEGLTALVSVVPLFGRWSEARNSLLAIVAANPRSAIPANDLANLEMATGRICEGKRIRDGLIAADPLAAGLCYKSVYQHWAVGDLSRMDHVADRAMQLWPSHPAVWMVRLWTLAYTDRVPAALSMLEDKAAGPNVPAPALAFLRRVLTAVHSGEAATVQSAVEMSVVMARTGPANAIASLFALGLLNASNEAFQVAEAYYLRCGSSPVPIRHTEVELSLNEQHRRLTQVLFMPVFARMRADSRFVKLCSHIGLTDYWNESGLTPDLHPGA